MQGVAISPIVRDAENLHIEAKTLSQMRQEGNESEQEK